MGRKGGGRKAFLKTAKPGDADEEDAGASPQVLSQQDSKKDAGSDATAEDPSTKFLVQEPKVSSIEAHSVEQLISATPEPSSNGHHDATGAQPAQSDETRGQLLQRHKRELKAHKEHTKKLGKKKKDEVEQLDRAIESRHNEELQAWDSCHGGEDLANTSIVAPTDGLYDLKIGEGDDKSSKKPTKAQKRREQRAAEEAEREARIEAEKAELQPDNSAKEKEAAELEQLLKPHGLTVKEVPDQLEAQDPDADMDYTELRTETASYMRAFPENFLPFVTQEESSSKSAEEQFEEYCDKIEETAAWGGQIELQALAQAIERHIEVHSAGMPLVELGTEYKGKQPPLQICYLKHAFTLGEHYNSLKPLS